MSNSNKARILHRGPWQIPYRAENVLCPDGVRRAVEITGEADTAFSIPAKCKAFGKTVSGTVVSTGAMNDDLKFIPGYTGKNFLVFGIADWYLDIGDRWSPDPLQRGKDKLIAYGVPSDWTFTLEDGSVVARDPKKKK